MRKRRLDLRLGLAGVLLFASVALVSAGRFTVTQYSSIQNDPLLARTYKLVGGGGFPPVPPTEETTNQHAINDTGSPNYNYIYAHEFNDATLYPVGSFVKWKVNRYTIDASLNIIYGVELSRGQTEAAQ
ncbi:MAG: hypothetical protein H7062_04795 [Candidatus Saccharimonas sp.]|nr:hypothetical protein [Planctomycetaceae bacterium]